MRKKVLLPLYFIEAYLIFSLILLVIGPLNYHLHSTNQFVVLIIDYHIAFVLGYFLGAKTKNSLRDNVFKCNHCTFVKRYSLLIVIVLFVWLVVTRNNTHASSYIPIDLFKKAISGLINPASRYYSNKGDSALTIFNGNKLMTGMILPLYFLYYTFPAITLWSWKSITKNQKRMSVLVIVLILLQGFASGINAIMFHVIFAIAGSIFVTIFAADNSELFIKSFKKHKRKLMFSVIICMSFGVWYFVRNINARLNDNVLAYFLSKSKDITISNTYRPMLENPVTATIVSALASIQSYICQGYFGMSLAIDQPFTSTWGLGHSFFLSTSIDSMMGTSIIANTYQEKITGIWSRTVNWHSFYSQIANDVGFYGVIIVMFILGIITSMVWKDIVYNNNPVAKLFFVVLLPVFIFMPMNNQMGNMYGTFCAFWMLFLLWVLSRNHVLKFGNRVLL